MAIPWMFALKAIPWGTILSKAPAIAKAADALLSGSEPRRGANEMRDLVERVAVLEKRDRANAELVKQVTEQVEAITAATEVIAARQTWLLILGGASLALAAIAIALVASR